MIYKITSLKRGSKKFSNSTQEGIFITGMATTKTGKMEKEMFIAEYFQPEMVAFLERAGVGATVDFKMQKKEGAKGPYFVPESAKLAEGLQQQEQSPPPSPPKTRGGSTAPAPVPMQREAPAPAGGLVMGDLLVKTNVLQQSVKYVLGMLGTVIKPAKATPELLDEFVVQRFRLFEGLITGNPVAKPASSTADLKPKQDTPNPPEVPDVPGPDGYDDDIPY